MLLYSDIDLFASFSREKWVKDEREGEPDSEYRPKVGAIWYILWHVSFKNTNYFTIVMTPSLIAV